MGKIASFFRSLFGIKKVENIHDLIKYINRGDIYDLANWIDWRVPYVSDVYEEDEWKTPNRTIKEGGDCDDKAVLAYTVIEDWRKDGWTAAIHLLERPNPEHKPWGVDRHAVCAFTTPKGERGVLELSRPYIYPGDTPWHKIFADITYPTWIGKVNTKGELL